LNSERWPSKDVVTVFPALSTIALCTSASTKGRDGGNGSRIGYCGLASTPLTVTGISGTGGRSPKTSFPPGWMTFFFCMVVSQREIGVSAASTSTPRPTMSVNECMMPFGTGISVPSGMTYFAGFWATICCTICGRVSCRVACCRRSATAAWCP
jgi:hypothetical protein